MTMRRGSGLNQSEGIASSSEEDGIKLFTSLLYVLVVGAGIAGRPGSQLDKLGAQ